MAAPGCWRCGPTHRLVVVLKARQLGVSWLAAIFALWTALRRPGQEVLLISRGQDDADKLLAKVAECTSGCPPGSPRRWSTCASIRFPAWLGDRGAAGDARTSGRSRTAALVILDEHAHQPYARKILLAVMAVAEQGKVLSISSANGQGALHCSCTSTAKAGTATAGRRCFVPAYAHPDRVDPATGAMRRRAPALLTALRRRVRAGVPRERPRGDRGHRPAGLPRRGPRPPAHRAGHSSARPAWSSTATRQPARCTSSAPTSARAWPRRTGRARRSSSATPGEQVAQLRGRWAPDVYAAKLDEPGAPLRDARRRPRTTRRSSSRSSATTTATPCCCGCAQLHAGAAPYAIYRAKDKRLGWLTTLRQPTRPRRPARGCPAHRRDHLHDAGTLDQLATFAWSDDGRAEAPDGYHDDDVLAARHRLAGAPPLLRARPRRQAQRARSSLTRRPGHRPTSGARGDRRGGRDDRGRAREAPDAATLRDVAPFSSPGSGPRPSARRPRARAPG